MKRTHISLILGLALTFALTGCSKAQTPNVTPTPSVAPTTTVPPVTATPGMTDGMTDGEAPGVAPTDNYEAGDDGHVDDNGKDIGETGAGKTVRNAVDDAGDVMRGAVRGTGHAIERVGDDIANTVR